MPGYSTRQVPDVPQMVMPETAQVIATTIIAAVGIVALVVAIVMGRRHRTGLYPLILVGGALGLFNEPIVDILGGCLHPQQGAWEVFTTFDRPMPVWGIFGYQLYFGAVPLIVLAFIRTGANPRLRFLQAVSVIFAGNLLIELPILNAGLYQYYGTQPFKIFDLLPLHWLFIDGVGVGIIVVILDRFAHRMRGPATLWALTIPSSAQVAAVSVGIPAFSLYNTDVAEIWKWLGSVATMLIGAAALYGLSRMLPNAAATGSAHPSEEPGRPRRESDRQQVRS